MAYHLFTNKKDISGLVGNVSWHSNVDTLGMQLDFNLAYSDMKEIPKNVVSIGDLIILKNNNTELFRGIVVSEKSAGRSPRSYVCFDFAFYLNKSKIIKQFNKHTASNAIQEVLREFNIPNKVVSIPTKISTIYKDKVVSDIIKDILSQATKELGIKYRMEMRGGTLVIEKQKDLYVKARVDLIGNPSRSQSIEEMKNSIVIVSGDEKVTKVVAKAKDNKNIKKYGLLQDVQSVDQKDIAKAQNIANQTLKELNVIKEDNSIELLGDDNVRAGRLLKVNEPITGIVGTYLITDCKQSLNNGIRKMSLTLGVT
ncbi:XkdQ/YqbQ family protein [Bacillus sp. JJ722]|uniref:XkdQ/YqbQ family protein n=1 Tax=Bacillus sp. JJ722 TaxID=3122973 RepID=UPI002FFF9243